MIDLYSFLAVVPLPMFPFWLYMEWPEIISISVAIIFLVYQIAHIWKCDKMQLAWVLIGAVLWVLIVFRFQILLETLFQSTLFFTLVLLNVFIILMQRYRAWSRIVFLDMTACYCICHVLVPMQRDHKVIVANIGILLVILIAYWIARLTGLPRQRNNLK